MRAQVGPDKEEDRRIARDMMADLYFVIAVATVFLNVIFFFKHGLLDPSPSRAFWFMTSVVYLYQYFKTRSRRDKQST